MDALLADEGDARTGDEEKISTRDAFLSKGVRALGWAPEISDEAP